MCLVGEGGDLAVVMCLRIGFTSAFISGSQDPLVAAFIRALFNARFSIYLDRLARQRDPMEATVATIEMKDGAEVPLL